MSGNIGFPFVINGVREEDIAKRVFLSMADFDVETLLRLRLVSKEWRDAIDFIYGKKLWGQQSLMRAVEDNRLDICLLILEHAEEKNPKDVIDTPLHFAAKKGHFDICRLIMDQVEDKNPKSNGGITPLHGLHTMVTWTYAASSLTRLRRRTQRIMEGTLPFMRLQ